MVAEVVLDLASDIFDSLDQIEDMTYTPVAGSSSSVRVAVSRGIQRVGFDSRLADSHDEATFLKSVITSPKRGDQVTDGSTKWELISPIIDDVVVATWLIKEIT